MTAAVTAPLPAAEVERARADLRDAIDAITTVLHRRVEFDTGEIGHYTAPPLLSQVEQEITQRSAKGASVGFTSRPTLWMDAAQFLADVDDHTASFKGDDRVMRVREWSARMSSAAAGDVVDAAGIAKTWPSTIDALLDPKPKMRLRGQRCPNCRAEKVWDRHDTDAGENHARPALEIDTTRGLCVCLHCDETWTPDYWEHLVQVLQQQRQEVLAATGYDPTVSARSAGEAGLHWYDVGDDDLPAAPASSRLRTHPDLIQCNAQVPIVEDGAVTRRPDGQARTRRCPALLDVDLRCQNEARHQPSE